MQNVATDIIAALKAGRLNAKELDRILNRANKGRRQRDFTKRKLLPYLLEVKRTDTALWSSWNMTPDEERALLALLQIKPRRTASGVATITVITKPHPCSSDCLYCPNDIRMPKSYLANEPACQRAERNFFDPYLQVAARVKALAEMGHPTDKIELIVLGGTWSDYPATYQLWFISGLFAALNDADDPAELARKAAKRRTTYEQAGFISDENVLAQLTASYSQAIAAREMTYNAAFAAHYGPNGYGPHSPAGAIAPGPAAPAAHQHASLAELERLHRANETATHRVVGFVIETRPDLITPASLTLMRRLGCTKIQMGVQSLDDAVLAANRRRITAAGIQRAFELLRIFGFKTHTHFMVNLYASTPQRDLADFARFTSEAAFCPDEVKLYPCALIGGTALCDEFAAGRWTPYDIDTLTDILARDVLATPEYTRISRMIRDFSSGDIIAGSKIPNLRQTVEQRAEALAAAEGTPIREIRYREINGAAPDTGTLKLRTLPYRTTATDEWFLQWVTPANKIAGFLRLSIPHEDALAALGAEAPVQPGEAMIREVHVYGQAARIGSAGTAAQHLGLGRQLIEHACDIAREAGCARINVISAIGTREYYRNCNFADGALYQTRELS